MYGYLHCRDAARRREWWPVALRCLLVDDNEQFLASATRLLESQGLDVVGGASSGGDALRLAHELAPEVVLVDVQLGEEDGVDLARRLTTVFGSLRVVLISSHSEVELEDLIAESPAVGFLSKTALSADAISALLD
jgi:two-component system nitrate/nitrite response regulator NarL